MNPARPDSATRSQVRAGLAAGMCTKEIMRRTNRSLGTVRIHETAIFRALGVRTRAQAALALAANGAPRARPSHDMIETALREIERTMRACTDGDITIVAALCLVNGLSDIAHPQRMRDVLEEIADERSRVAEGAV